MMHKKKVKGKWQYFKDTARISEYEYILPTEDVEEGSLALVKDKEYVFTDNKWKAVK